MYLPMCIGEVKTKFLIDNGAEVTIMSQKLFERIPENVRPKMVKTECNVKLEVTDKGLVQVAGVADISFCAGRQTYMWHVLIAPIEEEGLLGMDFLFAHNAGSLSRVPCDPTECMCYDGKTVLCDLPCGGCDVCQRKHEQWSSFQEVDDVVPLMARRVNIRNQVHPVHSRFGRLLTCKFLLFIGLCLSLLVWFKSCTGCFMGKKHQVRNKPGGESRWQRLNRAKTTQAARSNERMTGERDQTKEEGNSDQCKDSSGTGAQLPVLDDAWLSQYTRTDLRKLQLNDPDLAHLHTWLELEDGKPTRDQVAVESPTVRNLWLQWDQLVLDNGVLYRKWHSVKKKTPPCLQLVVPKSLQDAVLKSLNCNLIAGHLGVKKTTNKIKQKFYWYRLKDSVKLWIRNCTVCGARKSNRRVNTCDINSPKEDCDPRISLKTYKVGDYRDNTRTVGKSPKLMSQIWKGPCVIVKKLSDILFEIKTSLQSKSKILHFDRLKPYTSEIVPEMTVKLKKNTDSDIKNVLKLPQQGDKFSKNVTGLKRSTVKHCNGDMKVDKQLSDKQLPRRSGRQKQKPDRFMFY